MVGGLVEQQQVGLLQQQLAQRHAASLAAGQLGDVGVGRRQAQRVHGDLQLAIEVPGVGGVDLVLHVGLLFQQLRHLVVGHLLAELGGDLVEAGEQTAGFGHRLLDVAEHVLLFVELGLLGEVAHFRAVGGPRLTVVVGDLARHDAQQRRLTGAVDAEDTDLGAGKEGEPDIAQDVATGLERLAQPFHYVDEFGHGDPRRLRDSGEIWGDAGKGGCRDRRGRGSYLPFARVSR